MIHYRTVLQDWQPQKCSLSRGVWYRAVSCFSKQLHPYYHRCHLQTPLHCQSKTWRNLFPVTHKYRQGIKCRSSFVYKKFLCSMIILIKRSYVFKLLLIVHFLCISLFLFWLLLLCLLFIRTPFFLFLLQSLNAKTQMLIFWSMDIYPLTRTVTFLHAEKAFFNNEGETRTHNK